MGFDATWWQGTHQGCGPVWTNYQPNIVGLRPYHIENTSSCLFTEAEQLRAWVAPGWVTAWEYQVLQTLQSTLPGPSMILQVRDTVTLIFGDRYGQIVHRDSVSGEGLMSRPRTNITAGFSQSSGRIVGPMVQHLQSLLPSKTEWQIGRSRDCNQKLLATISPPPTMVGEGMEPANVSTGPVV